MDLEVTFYEAQECDAIYEVQTMGIIDQSIREVGSRFGILGHYSEEAMWSIDEESRYRSLSGRKRAL